jgi:hypothetical protein
MPWPPAASIGPPPQRRKTADRAAHVASVAAPVRVPAAPPLAHRLARTFNRVGDLEIWGGVIRLHFCEPEQKVPHERDAVKPLLPFWIDFQHGVRRQPIDFAR